MTKGRKLKLSVFGIIVIVLLVLLYFYQYSATRLEFLGHYDKVLAHRVNTLEKLETSLKHFKGVELDLVYDYETDTFDVNHPPTESINLNFETYLNAIKENTFPFLWLDIKNLKSENSYMILSKLNGLLEDLNYPKNKVLVETFFPVALRPFHAEGYKTCYYLKSTLHEETHEDLTIEIKNINAVLQNQPYLGLSASYENYHILNTHFPNRTKYFWAITSAYNFEYFKIREILNDKTVAIVLSQFKAKKGNR